MNFTDKQKEGCSEILKQFDLTKVISLTDTITKKSIYVNTQQDAIQAIISFSMSPNELLNRQKITRDDLMNYVFSKNISISGASNKQDIILQLMNYWSEKRNSIVKNTNLPYAQVPTKSVTTCEEIHSGNVLQFGQTFVKWFYKMFNSQTESSISPGHFWPDSALHLYFKSGQEYQESVQGAEMLAYKLKRLVSEEKLYFNPNNDVSGIMSKVESYGIVCVMVRGTVHKNNNCLGIFEQAFSLIRDPSTKNNWKIHSVKLKICTK